MKGMNKMKEVNLKVNGMMCSGCENRVKNALKKIENVEEVYADHNKNSVKIILKQDISIDILKDTIEDIGYEVQK